MSALTIYDRSYPSRLLIGTAQYPSPAVLQQCIEQSGTDLVTLSLRRQQSHLQAGASFFNLLQEMSVDLLPNTAGCQTVKEAVTLAHMSRELFGTELIKLEIIGDHQTLQPDMAQTLIAARQLLRDGFKVLPYCTDDLVACQQLADAGCDVIMPWASPIGTGRGFSNPYAMETLRQRLTGITLIVDAGLGKPSHIVTAFEMGFDAVLLNTALARAQDPVRMAQACQLAAKAGRASFEAVPMLPQHQAAASTPVLGMPFRDTGASTR